LCEMVLTRTYTDCINIRMSQALLVAMLCAADRCAAIGVDHGPGRLSARPRRRLARVRSARRAAPRDRSAPGAAGAIDRDADEAAGPHADGAVRTHRPRPPRRAWRRRADDAD